MINISSMGVLTHASRFGTHVSSKAALDAWTQRDSNEFADQGRSFTTINMPLVHTPMIASAGLYNNVPTLAPEEAVDMTAQACIFKLLLMATMLGTSGQLPHAALPRMAQIAMNTTFRVFSDSTAAKVARSGDEAAKSLLSGEAVPLQQMMRGIHS